MDFFEKNGFPASNSGIEIERLTPEDGKFSLFIKDDEKRVIGCGIYDPLIDEEELYMGSWWSVAPKIVNAEGYRNFEKSNCFFFILADNHYYLLDVYSNNPTQKKEKNIIALNKKIGNVKKTNSEYELNQLKSQVEELNGKINEYETSLQEKESIIESLRENAKRLEHCQNVAENLINEKKELKKIIKCEYSRNVITIEELKTQYSSHQIERLSQRPFLYGEEESELIYTVTGGRFTKSGLIEIAINRTRDSTEIQIRVEYLLHYYTSGGDGHPGGYYPNNVITYYNLSITGIIKKDSKGPDENDVFALINFSG